jgi:hypothetical protein
MSNARCLTVWAIPPAAAITVIRFDSALKGPVTRDDRLDGLEALLDVVSRQCRAHRRGGCVDPAERRGRMRPDLVVLGQERP